MSSINKVGSATGKYSVSLELNEDGSSDFIAEVVLPMKIVEGLKRLDKRLEADLKKSLREVFLKIAKENKEKQK